MSSRVIAATAVASVVALAGCGSSSSNSGGHSQPSLSTFKSGFATDKAQFRQLGQDLAKSIESAESKTDSQLAHEFASLSSRATQQGSQLRQLNPPASYRAQLGQLASDFSVVAGDLMTVSDAARTNNGPRAKSATTKLVQDSAKLKSVDVAVSMRLGLPAN